MSTTKRIAVIGGGISGMAAAAALAGRGLEIELFETRPQLGGRAGSIFDPRAGQWIDYCPHVWMGCCTNLADFCRRMDLQDCFTRQRQLHFIGPDGGQCDFRPSRWLPAPLNLLPAMRRLDFLAPAERRAIVACLMRLMKCDGLDHDNAQTIGAWLAEHGQTPRAVERFWSVVLTSALGETPDRASLAAARKVFRDGFLAARRASDLFVPRSSLGEIFGRRAAAALRRQGVRLHLGTRVARIEGDRRRATAVVLADGSRLPLDGAVLAVPWRRAAGLLDTAMLEAIPQLNRAADIPAAPITAVHLWFDRPITDLPHAVLVGRLGQWLFAGPRQEPPRAPNVILGEAKNLESVRDADGILRCAQNDDKQNDLHGCHYYQVVISASRALVGRKRQAIVDEIVSELAEIWPAAGNAGLRHARVVTQPAAVFSVRPGLDRLRPAQRTAVENLALAGDWTATGWPATMEGAVRGGYLAAEALLEFLGDRGPFLVPDLPMGWLARCLLGT